jgi:pimeloyl-ACP methyl ester carboxylesterase
VVVGLLALGMLAAWYVLLRRVEGSYFESAGVPIHYTSEGDGTPVVLLHGFAVNADLNWRLPGITDRLASEFRVIAVDQRGHGLSGKPHDPARYGQEMVEDVRRLLDHLQIDRAHLVGYSLGGFVALRFACSYPDRLHSVSVLGAGWERPDRSDFLAQLDRVADDLEAGRGVDPLARHLGEGREPGRAHRLWVRTVTRLLNDTKALGAMVRSVEALGVSEQELRALRVPVCSIVGSRDPLRPGAEALRGVVADLTSTVVEDADHLSATRSEALQAGLAAFLRERASGTSPAAP